ncbi:hypothetical protein [Streptomyces alanosinicus]|uniref:Uncharacterized protein n=1 Tax=Streptomyces alanosinicus TaxID=68171 RepID=A0A918YD65_9ACTN|nr:hypothetical protein [Streptomyces alanosinicus]GHD99946.1 hypothetical protein GCM10010339_12950 [Streptomyces alanosinicus]
MTNEFMGPPWQMDWRLDALASRNALPERVQKIVDEARTELVTGKDPYFRGIETDAQLPDGMWIEPAQSSRPKGPRVLYFDRGNGWLTYSFVPRAEDPQITVEQIFWQGSEPAGEPPAEE